MRTISKQIRISPKKLKIIVDLIRDKDVVIALEMLRFIPKKGAGIVLKALSSALANAENNFDQEKGKLKIKEIFVAPGMTYKRGIPISRGRTHPILKRNSRLTIELVSQQQTPKKKVEKEKTGEKTEKKTLDK